jgi:hypothetical protein
MLVHDYNLHSWCNSWSQQRIRDEQPWPAHPEAAAYAMIVMDSDA